MGPKLFEVQLNNSLTVSCFPAAVKSTNRAVVLNPFVITICLLLGDVEDLCKWDIECTQIHKDIKQMEEVGNI